MGSRSILLLEGAEHLARRKLMLPPFHGEHMRSYEEAMREAITAEIDSWRVGETFPIHPRMQSVTLEVILRAVFGVTDASRLAGLRGRLGQVLHDTASPMLQLIGLATRRFSRGPYATFEKRLTEVDRELYSLISERRADPELESREDILSALLVASSSRRPRALSRGHVGRGSRDQLMTLLLAGHETTATALAWTFDLLLGNPDKLERLTAEISAGDGDEYLRATISEGLRLRPVVPIAGRRLSADLSVNGLELPAGTDVAPAMWLTHTRPDVYPTPTRSSPSASSTRRPTPTPGSRSAAASAAASAPRSPSSRCVSS